MSTSNLYHNMPPTPRTDNGYQQSPTMLLPIHQDYKGPTKLVLFSLLCPTRSYDREAFLNPTSNRIIITIIPSEIVSRAENPAAVIGEKAQGEALSAGSSVRGRVSEHSVQAGWSCRSYGEHDRERMDRSAAVPCPNTDGPPCIAEQAQGKCECFNSFISYCCCHNGLVGTFFGPTSHLPSYFVINPISIILSNRQGLGRVNEPAAFSAPVSSLDGRRDYMFDPSKREGSRTFFLHFFVCVARGGFKPIFGWTRLLILRAKLGKEGFKWKLWFQPLKLLRR
jgi:hypothetical protein